MDSRPAITLLVFDRGGWWEVFAVDRVDGVAGVAAARALASSHEFAARSNVTEIKAVTYSLKDDPASGAYQLVRADALGPAQPVLDHVVKLEFRYFGEPLPPRLVDEGGEGARGFEPATGLRLRRRVSMSTGGRQERTACSLWLTGSTSRV